MSQMRQPDDDPSAARGLPEDNGWTTCDNGRCSITRCLEEPVAAIQRARGPRRPMHLQAYCEPHARARGVERDGGKLGWTAEFLTPSNSSWRAQRSSNP